MIMVTGATGNAGSAVGHALVEAGEPVRGLVRAGNEAALPEGAVAAAALTGKDHAGKAYPLTGPESLLPAERVAILGEVLGRDLRFEAQSDEEARADMSKAMPPEYVDAFMAFFAEGTLDESEVLPTVEEVTGRPPRSYRDWATEHAEAFR